MWILHDGVPQYFRIEDFFYQVQVIRWIGWSELVAWPAWSPDLNSLDFFF